MSRLPMAPPSSTPTPTMTRQPWQRPWSLNALTCEVPKASTTLRQMTALTSGPTSRRPALTGMSSHAQCEPSIVKKPVRKPLSEGLLNRGEMGQGPRWGGLVPGTVAGKPSGCSTISLRCQQDPLTKVHRASPSAPTWGRKPAPPAPTFEALTPDRARRTETAGQGSVTAVVSKGWGLTQAPSSTACRRFRGFRRVGTARGVEWDTRDRGT